MPEQMRNRAVRRAFTLIEILVVLVIMGFLTAMVAPKLSGILGYSEAPIDDANLRELGKSVAEFTAQRERLPRGLVNLVHENNSSGTTIYELLSINDLPGEAADLSARFADRLLPTLHVLNAAEAHELKRLGVGKVRNYRHTFSGGSEEYNHEVAVQAGVAVLMVGGGAPDASSVITWGTTRTGSINDNGTGNPVYAPGVNIGLNDATADLYAHLDGAPYAGRILLGLDNESELVTGGWLEKAGTSPKEARRGEVGFLHYALLLPRLDATVARMGEQTTLDLRKYDDEIETAYGVKTEEMNAATQRLSDVVVVSPQGYVNKELQFRYGVKIE